MLNSSLIKSLCQISALVYKPNSFLPITILKNLYQKDVSVLLI